MELLKIQSLEIAREKLFQCAANIKLKTERLPFEKAQGRTLSEDVVSPENVPSFSRSTVDGYAVRCADTAAASETIPACLKLVGQVEMGQGTELVISAGLCAEIPTGGALPKGADAVVMMEFCEEIGSGEIAVNSAVSQGENIVLSGEDINRGSVILKRGTILTPRHIGVLAAAGVFEVNVYCPMKLAIISTGDEIRDVRTPLSVGQVHDINSHSLSALAKKRGFDVRHRLLLPDDKAAILEAVRGAMNDCDVVLISGGSSKGKKDATREIIDSVASPGVFLHGLAIKPGKPTILGFDEESRAVLGGLPGHPVSAMMVFEQLFSALVREKTGSPAPLPLAAKISANAPAAAGMMTCIPVRLEADAEGLLAQPIFGKSGLITTLRDADGYICITRNCEGLSAGETVEVHLF